ncbi:MAG: hypothetical protein LT070_02420 [Solirubrobacteraceae bacterium]|nr:hypothetical protein [Solirubrobacteraceae bacterium]
MTRTAQVVFAAMVLAAFGAFFAAQALKSQPPVIQRFQLAHRVISPNGDGRFDRQRVTFRLKRHDTVDVAIVDERGDTVRELASGVELPAGRQLEPGLRWTGRTDSGHRARDGIYRVRITLRGEGRTVVVRRSFRVDTTPPRPRIASIGPSRTPGPELLPNPQGEPARIRLATPARAGRLLVFRTWPAPGALVRTTPIPDGSRVTSWDGTDDSGAPVAQGPYLAVIETRDSAGNVGTSAPLDGRGRPVAEYGREMPGRGGITVRRLALQAPLAPVSAGRRATVAVDSRQRPYHWTLRALGEARPERRGRAERALVHVTPSGTRSAVHLFTARRDGLEASVPIAVDDREDHRVLVVLPAMTWQGRNPVDDDGDGLPNLLGAGSDVRLARVFGTPLPPGFAARERGVLEWLAKGRRRFDLTTDVALATGVGPKLEGHRGVLLAGDAVWLPPALQRDLRRFVARGGALVGAGVDSLRRQARLTASLRLTGPTPAASADLFGSELEPLRRGTFDVVGATDEVELFRYTGGALRGYTQVEATRSTGRAKLVASAVDDRERPVVVALRVGRGLVVRFGLPELPSRLADDPDAQGLMERAWELLSR